MMNQIDIVPTIFIMNQENEIRPQAALERRNFMTHHTIKWN
jgi:hypothetical protein